MFPCFEPRTSELCGKDNVGPRPSSRWTPRSIASWTGSPSSVHQRSNSSVNSTFQAMTPVEYYTEVIYLSSTPPIARTPSPSRLVQGATSPRVSQSQIAASGRGSLKPSGMKIVAIRESAWDRATLVPLADLGHARGVPPEHALQRGYPIAVSPDGPVSIEDLMVFRSPNGANSAGMWTSPGVRPCGTSSAPACHAQPP